MKCDGCNQEKSSLRVLDGDMILAILIALVVACALGFAFGWDYGKYKGFEWAVDMITTLGIC